MTIQLKAIELRVLNIKQNCFTCTYNFREFLMDPDSGIGVFGSRFWPDPDLGKEFDTDSGKGPGSETLMQWSRLKQFMLCSLYIGGSCDMVPGLVIYEQGVAWTSMLSLLGNPHHQYTN